MTFVFRNNTIEPFFGKDYRFSGYGDISYIPNEDSYLWWYQLPLKFNDLQVVDEIEMFKSKLAYVVNNISQNKEFYIFTLSQIISCRIEKNNNSIRTAIHDFNAYIRELSLSHNNIKIVEIGDFVLQFNYRELIDWKYYFTSQIPYNPQIARSFRSWWENQKRTILLQRKKCLVLDLDNTLWAGILGEDGIEGIQMSGDYPGKSFYLWQEGIKELQRSGVMLAICSKNNMSDVLEVWQKRTDMLLKKTDFVAMRINWQDKASNVQELAHELNIGLDSFVFIDDNPIERELIRQKLPMVEVPDFPEHPYNLPNLYQHLVDNYFSVYTITEEDRDKTKQYAENIQRKEAESNFTNLDDFIASLDIHLTIQKVNSITLPRVAQMTQKTNQFNLTTRRYSEQNLSEFLDFGAEIWTLSVSDKFGDSGITGAIIITKNGEIDTFLLSCRVLGKGIEDVFLKYVLTKTDHKSLTGTYIQTAKNNIVVSFYDNIGFELFSDEGTTKKYKIDVEKTNLTYKQLYTINN